MRKFTMSNVAKYVVLLVIAYIVYSVYQKTSTPEVETEYWSHNVIDRNKQSDKESNIVDDSDTEIERENENDMKLKDQKEELDRRVKQQINRVFEEFKKQQEEKIQQNKNEREDVFKDYQIRRDKENINAENQFIRNNDDVFGNMNADAIQGDNGRILKDDNIDEGDNVKENDIAMFEVEEDKEKEKEELEVEKEIEERLAKIFKDSVHKAEDVVEKEPVANNVLLNVEDKEKPDVVVNHNALADIVKVPEHPPVYRKREQFRNAVNNVGGNLNPIEIHNMNVKAHRDALVNDNDHEFPPFVTAVRETTVKEVTQLVASIQQYFPGRKIYIYDLDLDKFTKRQLMSYCGVKMRVFMKNIFPSYVKNLDNMHWKPLVMQTALAEFGHMIWVNPKFRLTTQQLAPMIHESHEKGILVLGQSAAYTTYAATHPDMLKFIPSDIEKLSREPHFEIRAILIHNTDEVHQNVMKLFTACALEDSCLAPRGSQWACTFDFTGRKPAGCHRYDESALNILLKNWFNFDMSQYGRRNTDFQPYDSSYRRDLKSCRDPRDIKDKEL